MTIKEKKKIKENKKLCEEFPFLIPKSWNDELPEDYDYSYTELMDNGWRNLQINFFREIKPLLIKANFLDEYRIIQNKEKWGYWHLYDNGIPSEISKEYGEILRKYEELSTHTCMVCGDENAKMTYCGWIFPCCEKCWNKNKHWNTIPYEKAINQFHNEEEE